MVAVIEALTRQHLEYEARKLLSESNLTEYQAADAVVPEKLITDPYIENGRELVVQALRQALATGSTRRAPKLASDGIPFEEKVRAKHAIEKVKLMRPLMDRSREYAGERYPLAFLPTAAEEEFLQSAEKRQASAGAEVAYFSWALKEKKRQKVSFVNDLDDKVIPAGVAKAERLP